MGRPTSYPPFCYNHLAPWKALGFEGGAQRLSNALGTGDTFLIARTSAK